MIDWCKKSDWRYFKEKREWLIKSEHNSTTSIFSTIDSMHSNGVYEIFLKWFHASVMNIIWGITLILASITLIRKSWKRWTLVGASQLTGYQIYHANT